MSVVLRNIYIVFSLLLHTVCAKSDSAMRPNIVFIMADDLGFNDVGFRGSSQIPTPNIDVLAYSGLILNNYYVTPICTPSRSALMTGKYPIHTGMQHEVLYASEPRGLPLSETLMPQYLKELGYTTRFVGKWHLGFWKSAYTPTYRGFDSHLGFWTARQDYYDHTAVEIPGWGVDMRRNMEVAWDLHGEYSTDVFTKESVNLIKSHNQSQPLFLYLAHIAVHIGNPYNPLPAPDSEVAKFTNISDYSRRRFAAVLSKLDESVGNVVKALAETKMLENTIIVFSTDNGGSAGGFMNNSASNWPLRGIKNTLWEGGVRGTGFVWSPLLEKPKRISNQNIHITDWLPTLLKAAGSDLSTLPNIDGMDLWSALSKDEPSPRTEILHNIDDIYGNAALTVDNWKLMKGTTYNGTWDHWYGPSGRGGLYNLRDVISSPAGKALQSINKCATKREILNLRSQAELNCPEVKKQSCNLLVEACLFNIKDDPCEERNLAQIHPNILRKLEARLAELNATVVSPANLPPDIRADPKYWGHTWTNFGDYLMEKSA